MYRLNNLKAITFIAFIICFPSTLLANAEIQRQFSEAMQLLDKDPQLSLQILKNLNNQTDAVRIKLELARALFVNEQLHESKAVFLEIIKELPEDTPIQVFENIEYFLSEIHKRLNPVRLGFSIVRDSNPTLSTETQVIELFGLEFEYTPLTPVKEEFGLNTNLDVQYRPTSNSEVSAHLSHTQYESKGNSRSFILPEFKYRFSQKKQLWGRIGFEQEYQNEQLLRQGYFLGLRKYDNFNDNKFNTVTDLRVIDNEYPNFKIVNGKTYSISSFGAFRTSNNLILRANLGTEYTEAGIEQYRYRTLYAGYGFTYSGLPYNIEATVLQNHKFRRYFGKDPFFDTKREDDELTQSLTIRKRGLYIWGIAPSLNITNEQRFSNISIAEFSRTQVRLSGEKLF